MAKPLRGARAARVLGRNTASVAEMLERGIISGAEAKDLWRRLRTELDALNAIGALNAHQFEKVAVELSAYLAH